MPPSTKHELALLWLRDAPSRLSALLALTGHVPCPATMVVDDSALKAEPVDVVVDTVLRETASKEWALVEVQRQRDEEKARRWPLAMAAMGNAHGTAGQLVVLTASATVARWARRVAMHRGPEGYWGVEPTVLRLGYAEAEALLERGPPDLVFFAAWAVQGRRGPRARAIVVRALARVSEVGDERLRARLRESILAVLDPRLVKTVRREAMIDLDQIPKNPAVEQWKAELRAEGRVEGQARMLVRLLRRRGLVVSAEAEARLLATTDLARLDRWADHALVVTSVDELLAVT